MSKTKSFFKSGIMLTIVGLGMRTVGMMFSAYVSRSVGAEGMGLYTLIMTVYSFALTLATSGISLTVTRLVASAIGEGRISDISRILRGSFIYALIFGSLATLGLVFGADIIGGDVLSDDRTVSSLRVLAASLIPAALSGVLTGYFVGVKRVGYNAASVIFSQVARIFLTVALINLMLPFGFVAAVVGLCIGITITEILCFLLIFFEFLYFRHKNWQKTEKSKPDLSSVAATALPLGFSAYVRSFLLNVEHILIPQKLRESGESPSEAYSHYGTLHGMALPLVTYPMSPLSSFAGLLVPEFAEDMSAGRNDRMSRVASRALNLTLSYSVISAVFIFAFAEELGYVIYRSYDAGYYISTLSFVVPIMYLDHVTDSMLKGIGEQVFSMWVNITDSLLSVLLVWLLIPRMGIMGYAVVIVIMEGYNFLLSFIRLRRKVDFSLSLIKYALIPLAVSLIATHLTGLIFLFGGSTSSPVWLATKMLFALSITVFVLSLLNVKEGIFCTKSKREKYKQQSV